MTYHGLPWWLSGKESACKTGDAGLIPRSGRSPGERNVNPNQYSCLENPRDRGALRVTVDGVAKSWTCLADSTTTNGLSQDTEYSSLCCTARPCSFSCILCTLVCICLSQSPSLSLLHPQPPWQAPVCSLGPWFCFCLMNRFIYVIFQVPHINDIILYLFSDLLHLGW